MKENFDDILKRRWEERSFPLDESHRADMIELLNNQKRRRAFPFWWLGGLAIALVTGGLSLLAKGGSNSPDHLQPSIEEHQSTPSSTTEIAATTEAGSSHESELAITTSSVPAVEKSSTTSTSVAKSNSGQINHAEKVVSNTSKKSNSSSSLNKNSKDTTSPSQKNSNPSGNNVKSSDPANSTFYTVDENDAHSTRIVSQTVTVEVEPEVEPEVGAVTIKAVEVSPVAAQRNNFSTPLIDPLLIVGIDYESGDQPKSVEPKNRISHPFYLFGELGTGLVFASKPDFNSGWKLRAGAGLGYRLGTKMQLTLAGGYLMQHGGFDFERTSTVNTLGFGVRSSFNTLTPRTLHYVYARVGAQYRMQRHIIALHGGAQYMYGAYGTIVTQTEDSVPGGTVSVEKDSWVKTDGLQTLLWTGDIAYGYQVTPRLSAMIGTDIIFSEFTVKDPELTQAGYYWKGAFSSLQPFVTLNYLIHGHL